MCVAIFYKSEHKEGGINLSQESQSYLRFSLEESIWFRKGQEVEELQSISLEPDITIQENDQYATIRGSLQLSGEYKRTNSDDTEEGVYPSPTFIHLVEEREDGQCYFNHRFPIDITIPISRIQSIYDVHVEIETFDYVLPEPSCLKLTADLCIGGLRDDDNQQTEENEANEEYQVVEYQEEEPAFSRVHVEADLEPEINHDENAEEELTPHDLEPFVVEGRKVPSLHEESNESYSFDPPTKIMNIAEEAQFIPNIPNRFNFNVNQFDQAEEQDTVQSQEYSQFGSYYDQAADGRNEIEVAFLSERNKHKTPSSDEMYDSPNDSSDHLEESESESSSSPVKKKKKKSIFKKETLTLTEFFARKDDEDDRAKMKMCIVQAGETISYFAEKYGVNEQKILRVNRMDLTNDVYEGQVLYIPLKDEQQA